MADATRTYRRAVCGGPDANERLARAVTALERLCRPLRIPSNDESGTFLSSTLRSAMARVIPWPSEGDLQKLDEAVTRLAWVERTKPMKPRWKAYQLINRRLTSFRLINHVDTLVARAVRLLEDENQANTTPLSELIVEVINKRQRSPLVTGFVADLQEIRKRSKKVAEIKWEKYEHLLFEPNKPHRLACGDPSASPRVICYARVLEMMVENASRTREARRKAEPLVEWVCSLGNPKYARILSLDPFSAILERRVAGGDAESKKELARAKNRVRKQRSRAFLCRKSVT